MASTDSRKPDTMSLAGKRALIVDDDDDARLLLRAALESCQMTVHDADSVDGALAELDHGSFDVIISDIGMPNKDGHVLIQTVRARPDGDTIPAVALSSFTSTADRARALHAGFDRHFGKPFQSSSLIPGLSALLSHTRLQ